MVPPFIPKMATTLLPRTSGHFHKVYLVRISEPRPDHHFAPPRVPVRLKGVATLRVAPDCLRQRRRNFGKALRHQILSRSDHFLLGRRVNANREKHARHKYESFHRGTSVLTLRRQRRSASLLPARRCERTPGKSAELWSRAAAFAFQPARRAG